MPYARPQGYSFENNLLINDSLAKVAVFSNANLYNHRRLARFRSFLVT